jgi:hypothetical protein
MDCISIGTVDRIFLDQFLVFNHSGFPLGHDG